MIFIEIVFCRNRLLLFEDVWKIWCMQIQHDTSLALILYYPLSRLFPPFPLYSVSLPPLLPPSPVSFISAVRKLLTLLHTCKPERVKAFHKFSVS